MPSILNTDRRVSPELIYELTRLFLSDKTLSPADIDGLLILALGRGVQKQLFKDAGIQNPTRKNFSECGIFAALAIVDLGGHVAGVPALNAFDQRQADVENARRQHSEWCVECEKSWNQFVDGAEINDRWMSVLLWRQIIFDKVYPRKMTQFRFAAKEALGRLSELHDSNDETQTQHDITTALFEARRELAEKQGPGLFVGRDGQLRLGWRQTRDALAESRGISRRKRRREAEAKRLEIESDTIAAQDAQAQQDLIERTDLEQVLQAHLDSRLAEVATGSCRHWVLSEFIRLSQGALSLTELSKTAGFSIRGLHDAFEKERARLAERLRKET